MDKSPDAFRTISEVAEDLDLPQHVLRFWETRFNQIKPMKRGGGRRYYRPQDVELIKGIRHMLYDQGYTIKGVQGDQYIRNGSGREKFQNILKIFWNWFNGPTCR
jgi:DNA-binding transcriptional MerR regulator